MTDASLETRGAGDNRPTTDELIDERLEHLPETYDYLITRRDELLESASQTPELIEDEETHKKFATLAKLLGALIKQTKTGREGEKDYWFRGGKKLDAWFYLIRDPVTDAKASLETRQTEWQRKVAAIELRRRKEEERLAREEADRLAREAAKKEQEARDAKTLDDAVAAEAAAKQAAADAEVAAKAAAAKPADLSRSRSDEGAVASLRVWWDYRDVDMDKLDLEKLRHHFSHGDPKNAAEMAIKSYIKAGGRELDGVVIFENSRTVNH